jgi:hypothetical protein
VALEAVATNREPVIVEILGSDEVLGWSWLFEPLSSQSFTTCNREGWVHSPLTILWQDTILCIRLIPRIAP